MGERGKRRRVGLGLDADRHDDGVDAALREPGVVDHGGLERLGRVAEVGDQGGLAADHGVARSDGSGSEGELLAPTRSAGRSVVRVAVLREL
jgi:hypothetical protein